MPQRLKRATLARLVVGLTVVAFPLVATGAAQAAIAGASPAVTSSRPDLRSATILSSTSAEVCTDKTLNGVFTAAGFLIGGYRAGNLKAATGAATDPTNTNCAIVVWPSTIGDINQYSFVEAVAGTYLANSGSVPNQTDSVSLTGATSHSGTTAVTTGPNLVGILAPDGTHQVANALTFVFDKATNVGTPADLFYETSGGNVCTGASVLSGNDTTTVTITMSTTTSIGGATCGGAKVVQAVRGGTLFGGLNAVQDAASFSPNQSSILPNCASPCATSRPDVVSAVLGSGNDSIVFTFDHPVVVVGSGAGAFEAELSNGFTPVTSTGAVGTGGTTVTANFGGALSARAEYAVDAWAFNGSVEAADNVTPSGENLPGSAPIGDNAGAFASGFTTGPDVFGVSMNKTTGAVVANLDQRITAVNTASISVIGADGNVIATATPSTNFNSSAGPGPATLTLNYPPSQLTNATMLQFNTGALLSPLTPFDATALDSENVGQIDEAVQSGAILKAYKAYEKKHQKHHSSKKHHSHKR